MRRLILQERGRELGSGILHAVALVDDDVRPAPLFETQPVLHDELVRREHHVEGRLRGLVILAAHLLFKQVFARVRRALVDDCDRVRAPARELELPVGERGQRHDDEERAAQVLRLDQVRDQRDRLDGLAQTHFVGQDAVELVVVQRDEPSQPCHLVLLELASLEQLGLLVDARLHRVRQPVVGRALRILFRVRLALHADRRLELRGHVILLHRG